MIRRSRRQLHAFRTAALCTFLLTSALACTGHSNAVVPTVDAPAPAAVTKVLVFVEENHSLAQMQSGMPYAYSVAKQYGYASNYTATRHPSLPNYLAIAGGDTFGVADDYAPSSHKISAQTVFGQALAKGRTAKAYLDGMQSSCALVNGGIKYVVKHNPWAYFTSTTERSGCTRYDVPASTMQADITAGTLPNVGMVSPNLCNDAHDCSLATADSWFKSRMTAIMAGPDWRSGHLAVVLTADEDDRNSGNKVLTVVAHPSLSARVVTTSLTHYSLSRLLSQMSGSTPLRNAAQAPDLAAAFGLPLVSAGTTPVATSSSAAARYGWGAVVAGDEFVYTGAPDASKWGVYDGAGSGGHGVRVPTAWHVDGNVATVTGDSQGTTGGMSAKFGRRTYGRWETRMRTSSRDPHYHPIMTLYPDGDRTTCPEIDYVNGGSDTTTIRMFQHYACGGLKTTASRTVDTTQWHDYAVEVSPAGVTGYVDGDAFFHDSDPAHLPPGSMHETFQLDWFPTATATAQSTMSVAWTRVYDLTTAAPTPTSNGTPTGTPTATAAPATSTQTPAKKTAAARFGWGSVVAGDEFSYTGAPKPAKWSVYRSAGQSGKGLRRPAQWHVNGAVATVTGTSAGTTGGMSAVFAHRRYGRWETRMKTGARDPHYHPVLLLWPDGRRTKCPEIDYSEGGHDTSAMRFFQHYGCHGVQTYAIKKIDTTVWHNYAVQWRSTGVTGYVDGVRWFSDHHTSHLPPGPMHESLQLDWFPTKAASHRATMSIAWTRVYN